MEMQDISTYLDAAWKFVSETAIELLKTTSDQYGSAIVETLAVQQQAIALRSSLAIVGPTQRIEERLRTIMKPNKRFYKTPNTASIVFVLILTAITVSTTVHMHSVEAADLAKLPSGESTSEPNSPVSVSPDKFISVECVVYEVEASVLHDLVGKSSDDLTGPAVTMDQILIGKITTSAKTKELVRWGDSPTVVRLGELCTFALTTVIGYPTKYTINGYPAKYTIDSTSGKPLFKYAHTGLELQLTATRIQDSDMIFIAIETKSKKLHYDFAKDTQHSTEIPVIGGSFANAEVTAKFGQSILFSGLPVGGLASHETSDRCLAFVITPQRGDVSHQDKPNESRSRAVSRLAKTSRSANATPLAERYEKTRRDCGLLGFHLMVIISSDTENVTEFVDQNFVDYQTNKDVSAFMQIVFSRGRKSLESADTAFLKEQNWQLPAEGRVFACAIDAKGKELGRVEIDVSDKQAVQEAAAFIHQHAPALVDAEKKWHEAFTMASRSRRRVWARISQRYCGPCFRMARWLDDHHKLLEKDYVMLKIDNIRDQNGIRVAKRLTRGKNHGVPFHAIFDQDELMLIDSAGPLGNIGHPSGIEGKKQLRKMLLETRRSLTDAEIDQLVESLGD